MNRFKRADLSRVFPFVDFHQNRAIAADGTISFCFKADLSFQDQYTAQNYIDWVTLLAGCIKELPHHTLVQQVDIYFPVDKIKTTITAYPYAIQVHFTTHLKFLSGQDKIKTHTYKQGMHILVEATRRCTKNPYGLMITDLKFIQYEAD